MWDGPQDSALLPLLTGVLPDSRVLPAEAGGPGPGQQHPACPGPQLEAPAGLTWFFFLGHGAKAPSPNRWTTRELPGMTF